MVFSPLVRLTRGVMVRFHLGMAELGKYSSITEAIQSYRENSSYEEDNDATKANRYVTAIRWLLGNPSRAKGGGSGAEDEYDHATLREELKSARLWISRRASRVRSLDVDFTTFDRRT